MSGKAQNSKLYGTLSKMGRGVEANPATNMPELFETHQINLEPGMQLRITAGRKTIFVYRDRAGMHVRDRRHGSQTRDA